jgi:hypothetical protein
MKKNPNLPGTEFHTCNPSYLEGGDPEDFTFRPAQEEKF